MYFLPEERRIREEEEEREREERERVEREEAAKRQVSRRERREAERERERERGEWGYMYYSIQPKLVIGGHVSGAARCPDSRGDTESEGA